MPTLSSSLGMLLFAGGALAQDDPNLWLEEVDGEKATAWVQEENRRTAERLEDESFEQTRTLLRGVLDSNDRIPMLTRVGSEYRNFWRDKAHPRGVWRRTTLASYKSGQPQWETLLDLDALAREEGESWVWKGAKCLPPAGERCLISLSRGGADAVVIREFDTAALSFLDGGFQLPEAKGGVAWVDRDTLLVRTNFGDGSLTDSGYPRIVKRWRRGTPLEEAETLLEAEAKDVMILAWHDHTPGYERTFASIATSFFTSDFYEITPKGPRRVEKPASASGGVWRDHVMFKLRDDWEVDGVTYAAGSLVAAPYEKWKRGKRKLEVLFEPSEVEILQSFQSTRSHVVLSLLSDVKVRTRVLTPGKRGWSESSIPGLPETGQVSIWPVDSRASDDYWIRYSGFLTPTTYGFGTLDGPPHEVLAQRAAAFDATGMTVSQHFAVSKDGTRVPYFQVSSATGDEPKPTLLTGYGGFEVSRLPYYGAGLGKAWLEKGGNFVLANIRGGGEYGPNWHKAALKENRHRAYEDFAAVARDLVSRGVTTRKLLAAKGGSNGGLLMGNMYTLYPEDFGAIICQVPLLDMKRYSKLLAGASWMAEYGDPDKAEEWAFLKTFSPYHNLDPSKDYPALLVTTSTRDDRVHPGHARKFVAALRAMSKDVLYYENIEGGHGGAANNKQSAYLGALVYRFMEAAFDAERQGFVSAPPEPPPEEAPEDSPADETAD